MQMSKQETAIELGSMDRGKAVMQMSKQEITVELSII
jgi:hypothetical protein